MQPGQTFTPGENDQKKPTAEGPGDEIVSKEDTIQEVEVSGETAFTNAEPSQNRAESISWTASEFIEHTKPRGWYLSVMLGGVVISALLYLMIKDVISVVVVLIATGMFLVAGSRKPESKQFEINYNGIKVGNKSFGFDYFKSFSVIEEGAIDSVQLMPLKNFEMPISIYFPPDMYDQVTGFLADYLPHEEKTRDAVDRLMRKLKF